MTRSRTALGPRWALQALVLCAVWGSQTGCWALTPLPPAMRLRGGGPKTPPRQESPQKPALPEREPDPARRVAAGGAALSPAPPAPSRAVPATPAAQAFVPTTATLPGPYVAANSTRAAQIFVPGGAQSVKNSTERGKAAAPLSPEPAGQEDANVTQGMDYTKEAIAFFETERTHTALFTAVSVSMLWALPLSASSSAVDGFVRRAYHWFAALAVVNSILTVFTCAVAIPRLMCRRHALNAESPFNLLLRERPLRLYYLSVRTHSLSGIICFCTALAVRMFYEYRAGCPRFARALTALVICVTAHMMTLLMASLTTFSPHINSFGSLWRTYFQELLAAGCVSDLNAANVITLGAGAFVIFDSLMCFISQFSLALREVHESLSNNVPLRFSPPSQQEAVQEEVGGD